MSRRFHIFTAAALLWKASFVRAFWPLTVAALLVLALLLTGWLPQLNWIAHAVTLGALALVLAVLLIRDLTKLRRIRLQQARRKVEYDSRLYHRPISSRSDSRAVGADSLWRAHKRDLSEQSFNLHVGGTDSGIAAADRFGLRFLAPLLLAVAVVFSWGQLGARLEASLSVTPPPPPPPPAVQLTAWITPPDYTRLEPLDISGLEDANAPAGSEIRIQAQITGEQPDTPPSQLEASRNGKPFALTAGADGLFSLQDAVDQDTLYSISDDGVSVVSFTRSFDLTVIPDAVPVTDFTDNSRTTEAGSVRLAFKADDDYALTDIRLLIEPADGRALSVLEQAASARLLADSLNVKSYERTSFTDLTDHPLAGQVVKIRLEATDVAGQTGLSEHHVIQLPERTFEHPVARQLDRLRDQLFAAPEKKDGIAAALEMLAQTPELYDGKPGIEQALQQLSEQLAAAPVPSAEADEPGRTDPAEAGESSPPAPESAPAQQSPSGARAQSQDGSEPQPQGSSAVPQDETPSEPGQSAEELARATQDMWELARRIDDDPIRRLEEELRRLQEELRDALARGASEEELLALMDELRQKMEEYRDAIIAQKLAEMLESGELNIAPPDMNEQSDALNDLADQFEDMARKGAREEAEDLLNQLQEMLENLKNSQLQLQMGPGEGGPGMPGGQGGGSGQSGAQQMMNELGEIMRQQQDLLDRTFRSQQGQQPGSGAGSQQGNGQAGSQPGNQPGSGQPGSGQPGQGQSGQPGSGQNSGSGSRSSDIPGALEQDALRRDLNNFMRGLGGLPGGIPGALGEAGRSMGGASGDLREGDLGGAGQNQAEALSQLQKGAQALADALAQMGEGAGAGQGQGEGQGQGQGEGQDGEGQGEGSGRGQQQGRTNDSGTDPLGRAYGHGDLTDVPDGDDSGDARAIQQRLRKRLEDPALSQTERDYIRNLLDQFR